MKHLDFLVQFYKGKPPLPTRKVAELVPPYSIAYLMSHDPKASEEEARKDYYLLTRLFKAKEVKE